jgi:signal transduction histidine kinase
VESPPLDRPATVLVVDDEPALRAVLKGFLAPTYRVVEAADGVDALAALESDPIDLALLDIRMPRLDGFAACREIKRRTTGKGFLPVILLTAWTEYEHRTEGFAAGADDFLAKPVDARELLLRVRAFLRLREQDTFIRRQLEEVRGLQAMKDDLFGLVVHDLRNPLSGIRGYLRMAGERLAADAHADVQAELAAAEEAAAKLEETIEAVLDVRALEERRLRLARERVALGALARDAAATLAGYARAIGVGLEVSAEARGEVDVDRRLFRRAIENLIANALKHSQTGASVEVLARVEPDGRAVVEVADRGPGVPEAARGQLFETLGAPSRAGERRGFGLGLHLVRVVAEAHGGSVSVRDREGGGAVFRLALSPP